MADYTITVPKIVSAIFSENPTTVNAQITITVEVTTETKVLPQEIFYANEIYSGEV
jgi:hypothetical protein